MPPTSNYMMLWHLLTLKSRRILSYYDDNDDADDDVDNHRDDDDDGDNGEYNDDDGSWDDYENDDSCCDDN